LIKVKPADKKTVEIIRRYTEFWFIRVDSRDLCAYFNLDDIKLSAHERPNT